ncbi:MAG: hypothetical protein U9R28_00500 [Pseudomonadota bacterium]|nr:hypothetical protein [Pseudomonadota bacterium]
MKPVLKSTGLLAFTVAALALSGCSTTHQVQKINDETFYLTEFFNEPVQSFDSWSLRRQAKELCPKGHHSLLRKAGKASEMAKEHASCASGADCEYALEWRIQCTDRPEEKFTIFGKS